MNDQQQQQLQLNLKINIVIDLLLAENRFNEHNMVLTNVPFYRLLNCFRTTLILNYTH